MVQRYEQMRRLQWYKRGAAYDEKVKDFWDNETNKGIWAD